MSGCDTVELCRVCTEWYHKWMNTNNNNVFMCHLSHNFHFKKNKMALVPVMEGASPFLQAAANAGAHYFRQPENRKRVYKAAANAGKAWHRRYQQRRKKRTVNTRNPDADLQRCNVSDSNASHVATLLSDYQVGSYIIQGLQINQRLGQAVYLQGLHMNYEFRNNSTSYIQWVRCLIVQRRAGGDWETGKDLFRGKLTSQGADYDTATADLGQIEAPVNTKKYTVIKDKKWKLLPENVASMGRHLQIGSFFVPMKKRLTYENQTVVPTPGEPASIEVTPNIYVLWFNQNETNSTSLSCEVKWSFWEYYYTK